MIVFLFSAKCSIAKCLPFSLDEVLDAQIVLEFVIVDVGALHKVRGRAVEQEHVEKRIEFRGRRNLEKLMLTSAISRNTSSESPLA